jgi:hypothetical protein
MIKKYLKIYFTHSFRDGKANLATYWRFLCHVVDSNRLKNIIFAMLVLEILLQFIGDAPVLYNVAIASPRKISRTNKKLLLCLKSLYCFLLHNTLLDLFLHCLISIFKNVKHDRTINTVNDGI